MNTPSPLIPQGAMVHPQGKSHFRIAVFTILAVHIVLLGALLLQGCKRSEEPTPGGVAQPGTGEETNLIGRWEPPPPPLPDGDTLTSRTPQPTSTPPETAIPPLDDTNPPPVLVSTNDVIPVPPPVDPVSSGTEIETTPVTPSELAVREHTIKSGDNFYELAKEYNVTVAAIEKQNPNKDPRRLQVGDVITIPPPQPAAPSPTENTNAAGQTLYEVKSGDNLTRIAARHDTTISALRSANNLTSDRIIVGQKLIIP